MLFMKICLNRMFKPQVAVNNLRAECDVNNEAKFFRIEIVFATVKPAIKSKTKECNLRRIPLNVRAISARGIYQKTAHSTVTF